MNCRRISSLISAYIDGELTGEEMLEIRRHLHDCGSCQEQYESLRDTKQAIAHLAYAEPRSGLAERISALLGEVQIPGYQRVLNGIRVYTKSRLTPVAAGCAAFGVAIMLLVFHAPSEEYSVADYSVDYPPAVAAQTEYASPYPLMSVPLNRGTVHSIVPEPTHSEWQSSQMMTFASFEQH